MILQQKAYAEGAIALCLYCAALIDKGSEDAESLHALLTPVAKTWHSEFGLIANDLAIQVHGGYGYTRDFDEIGRGSCRERVCKSGYISVGAASLKKKNNKI